MQYIITLLDSLVLKDWDVLGKVVPSKARCSLILSVLCLGAAATALCPLEPTSEPPCCCCPEEGLESRQ